MKKRDKRRLATLFGAWVMLAAGCQREAPSEATSQDALSDKAPSEVNEDAAGGARPEKLVFAFQKQKDPKEIQASADTLAQLLSTKIGLPVEVLVPASYGATVQAVVSGRAHVFYTSSIPYILAKAEAPVDVLLVEERDGRTDYDSVFVVKKDAPFQSLSELKGKRMMFTSPTSTSGYVMAYSRLVDEGLLEAKQKPDAFFSTAEFANGYDKALLAVLNGQADACAVSDYTMEGPKAGAYLTTEDREGLRVLSQTPGVPTHLIGARADLPQDLRDAIKAALLEVSRDNADMLADVYGAARFVESTAESHLVGAVKALTNTGLAAQALVK